MRKTLWIATILILLLTTFSSVHAEEMKVKVYYLGDEDSIYAAIDLADNFEFVIDLNEAQVIVLNGEIQSTVEIAARVKQGAGLIFIPGENLTGEQVSSLFGEETNLTFKEEATSLSVIDDQQSAITQTIDWGSAPQIRERIVLVGLTMDPMIISYENNDIILAQKTMGEGTAYLFMAFLNDFNFNFQDWPFFNYFIYNLVMQAAGHPPLSFGDYPGSPVPHTQGQTILLSVLGGMLLTAGLVFTLVRRYSKAHPEALDEQVASRDHFKQREEGTSWEEVGFHRPLGGYLFAMMTGVILFIPMIIYQDMILPTFILPSAQALGIWGRVTQVFLLAWTIFDVGTSLAFVKFFSQYRVRDPRRAIQYGQVFVWWQALSGALQVALVTIVGSIFLPKTPYGLYAWAVIAHALIQIPGFYAVMRHALYAQQRLDYAQILEHSMMLIFPMITQPILVTIMVAWGQKNAAMGMSMGGVLGLAMAAYASELLVFLLGLWLYRRVGYNARILFLAHFDWSVIKESFRFGVFEMMGSLAFTGGQALEIFITQTRLLNYAEIWGNWIMAQNFVFAYSIVANLNDGVMPSISEAISSAKKKLSQYYSAMAYKWGGMISGFLAAVLLAIADRFILGAAGQDFERVALYVIPLTIWGSIQFMGMTADIVHIGSNKPYLKFIMTFAEQLIRVVLALLLIARFQVTGLVIAYFIGLLFRGITAYFVNHKFCFPQRFFFWQTVAAPILATSVHYLVLRTITGWIWQGEEITSIIIFLIGILFSYPVYMFFYGLFGGWDDATLNELKEAAELSPFMKFMSRLFYISTAFGARYSPLHNRFPVSIREEAMLEAKQLTKERVKFLSDNTGG